MILSHQQDAGPGTVGEGLAAVAEVRIVDHVAGEPLPDLAGDGVDGLVVLGAAADVDEGHAWMDDEVLLLQEALARDTPVLGICAGAQLLALAAGGEVHRMDAPERGWHPVDVLERADPLLGPLPDPLIAAQWHAYTCVPPAGPATVLATNAAGVQAFKVGDHAYGVQFHPEVRRDDLLDWARRPDVPPELRERVQNETGRRAPQWEAAGRELGERFAYLASRQKSL